MTQRTWIRVTVAVTVAVGLACTSSHEARESDVPAPEVEQRIPTIDHVSPARDSVGARPSRFEWTAAKDADHYAIGVWDDVDRLIWRDNRVQGTSVTLPADIEIGFGTYFWSVTALADDNRPLAETGRSAFVVR
jgi:hypothetical protein